MRYSMPNKYQLTLEHPPPLIPCAIRRQRIASSSRGGLRIECMRRNNASLLRRASTHTWNPLEYYLTILPSQRPIPAIAAASEAWIVRTLAVSTHTEISQCRSEEPVFIIHGTYSRVGGDTNHRCNNDCMGTSVVSHTGCTSCCTDLRDRIDIAYLA